MGGLKVDQTKRLNDLERENERLKKAMSELTLDKLMLKEPLSGKYEERASSICACIWRLQAIRRGAAPSRLNRNGRADRRRLAHRRAQAAQHARREASDQGRPHPEDWKAKPAKLRRKDRDARWTVKFSKAKERADRTKPALAFGSIRRWDASDAAAYRVWKAAAPTASTGFSIEKPVPFMAEPLRLLSCDNYLLLCAQPRLALPAVVGLVRNCLSCSIAREQAYEGEDPGKGRLCCSTRFALRFQRWTSFTDYRGEFRRGKVVLTGAAQVESCDES